MSTDIRTRAGSEAPTEEIRINFWVSTEVVIDFGETLSWISLRPAEALAFAAQIDAAARKCTPEERQA